MLPHIHRQLRSLSTAGSALRSAPAAAAASAAEHQHGTPARAPGPQNVIPVIGLEVHAQINTRAKLFSRGGNSSQASPNSQLDLLDVSIPGTLPKLNGAALRAAILTGLGLNCTIQDVIHFDRKNYFYSDMPAGFQITQYNKPIALQGYIDFIVTTYHRSLIAHSQQYDIARHLYHDERARDDEFEPYVKRSHIKQLQLEQDSAKTLHQTSSCEPGGQQAATAAAKERVLNDLVDYNRSGSALVEIVFEPDLTSPHEASSLVRELIMLLRALKTCDCELQEGSLRVDANVSIASIEGHAVPKEVANRVELKNLNSLRSLNRGIAYEIQRQAREIAAGKSIAQESRTYDTKRARTTVLRAKETAVDYRYVPEPSLPPLSLDRSLVDQIRQQSLASDAKLPARLREKLTRQFPQLGLVAIMELVDEPGLAEYFMAIMDQQQQEQERSTPPPTFDPAVVADFLIYAVANLRQLAQGPTPLPLVVDLEDQEGQFLQKLSVPTMRKLFVMMFAQEIGFAHGYETMKCLFTSGGGDQADRDPRELVQSLGWHLINDEREVERLCTQVIEGMPSVSRRYAKRGDKSALRLMLLKLAALNQDRVCVPLAIKCFQRRLKPPPARSNSKPDDASHSEKTANE